MPTPKTKSSGLAAKLKQHPVKVRSGPLWLGPCSEEWNGGVTQSMLAGFMCCRERFRVRYIEGIKSKGRWNHLPGFGSMWHICEEHLASNSGEWSVKLMEYAKKEMEENPLQRDEINHWYDICRHTFPIYVKHWEEHPDVKNRTPLIQEGVFNVPYKLPSGRVVRLKGKYDSVDLIQEGKTSGIFLQENKAKSGIDQIKLRHQLSYDNQTMMYLIALQQDQNNTEGHFGAVQDQSTGKLARNPNSSEKVVPIKGVRYNVVRRSAHKTVGNFIKKIEEDMAEKRHEEWFLRLRVEVSQMDIDDFKRKTLNPLLEGLCDWHEFVTTGDPWRDGGGRGIHFQLPFGVYNPLLEGGNTDTDNYLAIGDMTGLTRTHKMFEELKS